MRKIFSICIALLIFCVAASACNSTGNSNEYVLTIDGDKILKTEYMVYLYEQKKSFEEKGGLNIWGVDFDGMTAEEVAKQNAVNSIMMVKAAVKYSKSMNISVENEDAEIKTEAESLLSEIKASGFLTGDVESDDIYEIIKESHIQQAVYDSITNGFESSELDFEAYLDNYYEQNKEQYSDITVDEIYVRKNGDDGADKAKIEQANAELSSGADFEATKKKYSERPDKESYLLSTTTYGEEIYEAVAQMSVGQVSIVMEDSQGYYIFKVMGIQTTSKEGIRDTVEAIYIREKKQEIYEKQNDKWTADMVVEKNKEVWDSIKVVE